MDRVETRLVKNHPQVIHPAIKRVAAGPGTVRQAGATVMPIDHLEVGGEQLTDMGELVVQQAETAGDNQRLANSVQVVPQLDSVIVGVGHTSSFGITA